MLRFLFCLLVCCIIVFNFVCLFLLIVVLGLFCCLLWLVVYVGILCFNTDRLLLRLRLIWFIFLLFVSSSFL